MADFDLKKILKERTGDMYHLHSKHINKQFVKVVKTIGFDKAYTRANGYYLYDKDNKRYIDFITGYGVFALGRNHPVIVKAIMDFIGSQAPHLLKMDCAVVSGLAAECLIKIAPDNLENVFFTNSGSESVDTAMKYAKCFTKRDKFVFLKHAFHGLTIGPLSVNGNIEFKDGFGKLLDGCQQIPFNDLEVLERALKNNDVAAFIFEPIQGKGVYLPDHDYFPQAETLCRKYGALMIADEIQTGCGRTGKFFAFEHFGITPDIVTLSKALSGGMIPVGAVLSRQDIHDSVFSKMDRCVVHSSTFSQNGLAMAAVLATLHVIESENILDNVIHLERIFLDGLNQHRKKYDIIKEIRGKGVMIGIEFTRPQSLGMKTAWDMIHRMNQDLFTQTIIMPLLNKHRILTQVAGHRMDVIKLLPALTLNPEDALYFLQSFECVLTDCSKFPGSMWTSIFHLAKNSLLNR
ncbi:aspartate aminotransferase family protein [PVC group bacterium]|nr:aspartate aminotransferase family protein [PVC group bacterium]